MECTRLLEIIGNRSVEGLQQELDESGLSTNSSQSTLSLGPFGVFSIQSSSSPQILDLQQDDLSWTQLDYLVDVEPSLFLVGQSNLEESEVTPKERYAFGPEPSCLDPPTPSIFFSSSPSSFNVDGIESLEETRPAVRDTFEDVVDSGSGEAQLTLISPLYTSLSTQSATDIGDLAPSITNLLLSHYKENLISQFMSLEHHKPPWQVLHLPCATSAYGEIAISGDTNNAKASLLFAIFAISALNLDRREQQTSGEKLQWRVAGELYRDRAKKRLQACLREQDGMIKTAKYKEVLMAILSMVTICVSL